jgi:hypothetical protein
MDATIPMRGRMIHGKDQSGRLYEHAQDYDAKGRVRKPSLRCAIPNIDFAKNVRQYSPLTGPA